MVLVWSLGGLASYDSASTIVLFHSFWAVLGLGLVVQVDSLHHLQWMVLLSYSCNTLMIGLALQSAPADWWCLHWIPEPVDPSIYNVPPHPAHAYSYPIWYSKKWSTMQQLDVCHGVVVWFTSTSHQITERAIYESRTVAVPGCTAVWDCQSIQLNWPDANKSESR